MGRVEPFRGLESIQVEGKPWAENADKFGGEGQVLIHAPHDELANTTRCLARGGGANADRVVTLIGASRSVRENELTEVAGLAAGVNSAVLRREVSVFGHGRLMVVYRRAEVVGRLLLCRAEAARNAFIFRHSWSLRVWRDRLAIACCPHGENYPRAANPLDFQAVSGR